MKKLLLLSVLIFTMNGAFAEKTTDSLKPSSTVFNLGYNSVKQIGTSATDLLGIIPIVGDVLKIIPETIFGITDQSVGVISGN